MDTKTQLEYFTSITQKLTLTKKLKKIDEFGFCYLGGAEEKIDLLITGLIHGDEVIGLEVINNILSKIASTDFTPDINVAFLLGNLAAYKMNLRFCEYDLNRAFGCEHSDKFEIQRAREIELIIKNSKAVFDIHQTIEPTLHPFFIFPFNIDSIKSAALINLDIPILTFKGKEFSSKGQTLIEFAQLHGCTTISIETGQKGFNTEMASRVENIIFKFIEYLSLNTKLHLPSEVTINQIFQTIHYSEGRELIPGLQSCQPVKRGDVIGKEQSGEWILSPIDGVIFFPKYNETAKSFGVLT
jgi:succinylglutamate desuccinylase